MEGYVLAMLVREELPNDSSCDSREQEDGDARRVEIDLPKLIMSSLAFQEGCLDFGLQEEG